MNLLPKLPVLLCLCLVVALSAPAQVPAPPPVPAYQPLSATQLDQLLGPIALYPDPLIAQLLPAATVPAQVVLADRYVSGGGAPAQIEQQPWDASVQAMARYSNVLKWMDDNLKWTTELGQAFLNQQPEVMTSIQRLRGSASKLGNLQSSPQQQVVADGGNIEIVPADPQLLYVPVYQPAQVYYQAAEAAPFIAFGVGWPLGGWMNYDCDWGDGSLIFWTRDHPRPFNWWHEDHGQRDRGHGGVWRPGSHPGSFAGTRGDRGWSGGPSGRSAAPALTRQDLARSGSPGSGRSVGASRPAPAVAERSAPISRPPSNGAFLGIHSSSATRSYSTRGRSSLQNISRSAPAARSAPSSGGGARSGSGGARSSGKR